MVEEEGELRGLTETPQLKSILFDPGDQNQRGGKPVFVTSKLLRIAIFGAIGAGFTMAAGGAAASALWHLPGRATSSVVNFATTPFRRRSS